MERPEKSVIPGTAAHRAHLRQILDEVDQRQQGAAADLTNEQRLLVSELIDKVLQEPAMTRAQVIELLEELLTDPELGVAKLYQHLEDHQSVLRHAIAQRAFRLGLDLGSRVQGSGQE